MAGMRSDPEDHADVTIDQTEASGSGVRETAERLIDEFAERCRRGESPSVEEYERRHPEHAEVFRRLLPSVAMMEGLKRQSEQSRCHEAIHPLPERLGEFRIVRELGRGGMGVVYEAIQESLGRRVALKIVPRVHLDARKLQRFRREAEAVAQLHHTNIVPIFGVGEADGLPFYVMQLIHGTGLDTLLERWQREGPLPDLERWRFTAHVGLQAARAVHYAHDQGILHRDIKPANLLIDEQETVWITDFGLAKLAGQNDLTGPGDIVGTLRYLAPEGLRGIADARSDIYGLGLTLYELLTLSPPFGDLSPSELLRHVGEEQPTRPRKLCPTIPRDLETIVLKAIAREPGHRYESAGALAADLECFIEDRPIHARRVSPFERAWRWGRRNRLTAGLSALAVGALVLAAILGWVGYVNTTRALGQAQANESLSLDIFQRLFERLDVDANFLPPPPGRSSRRRMPSPSHRTADPFGLAGLPKRPPAGIEKKSFRPPRPEGRPGGPGPREDPSFLDDVLAFYDRFAQQNAANVRLQIEAAWAYRRVGAIHESLGQWAQAEQAYGRAITMMESLVALHPGLADHRAKLVETYIMANPWTAEDSDLHSMEQRLRRAESHLQVLESASPKGTDWIIPMIHVQAKLATVLKRTDRLDEAESRYRRALELATTLLDHAPDDMRARLDRADSEEALALLETERGRTDQARAHLEASAADLRALATRDLMPAIADRAEDLAEDYQTLGDKARGEEMSLWASRLRGNRPHSQTPADGGS